MIISAKMCVSFALFALKFFVSFMPFVVNLRVTIHERS
jgi:hypothetical protein